MARRRIRHAMADRPSVAEAASWVAVVTLGERQARRSVGTRSGALLALYAALGLVAASRTAGRTAPTTDSGHGGVLVLGLGLTFGGYQLGRWLLDDRPSEEPSESLTLEVVSLGVVVPLVEELIWGARVEPAVGLLATSAAFAVKHPVVDGRWRRTLGLGLFWTGLALLRRRSRSAAAVAHVSANTGAVLLGHLTGRDRF
jgi:hypothetical protein